jgi:hypothetical protein
VEERLEGFLLGLEPALTAILWIFLILLSCSSSENCCKDTYIISAIFLAAFFCLAYLVSVVILDAFLKTMGALTYLPTGGKGVKSASR